MAICLISYNMKNYHILNRSYQFGYEECRVRGRNYGNVVYQSADFKLVGKTKYLTTHRWSAGQPPSKYHAIVVFQITCIARYNLQ